MGKASRWFRSLVGSKKSPESSALAAVEKKKSKSATSSSANASIRFKNGAGGENHLASPYEDGGLDANKHAIAVAAATAAVADAAIAAAQAAAEVVKLTSGSWRSATPYRGGDRRQPVVAAVKIQSAFRAYLARRALRALKALVKLQARVRGYIVRKQSADLLRRMQAMARIQARASAHRSYTTPESSNIDTNSHHSGITNPRKYEEMSNTAKHTGSLLKMQHSHLRPHTTWLNHWMEQSTLNINNNSLDAGPINDEKSDKILEIDTWKPHQTPRQNNRPKNNSSRYFSALNEMGHDYSKTRLSSKHHNPNPSISSEEVQSLISPKFQVPARTAVISPGGRSSSSRPTSNLKGPFTPTRNECSRSVNGEYLSHPNYMASTTSSWAKVRSQSAPKQRMQFDDLGFSTKIGRGFWESDVNSEKGSAYRYMGQLKRQVNPTYNENIGFSSTYRYRL